MDLLQAKEPIEPSQPISQSPISNSPKKNVIFIISAIVVGIILVGGTAYAYFEKIGPFASPPYNQNNLIEGVVNGIKKIDSTTYNTVVKLESKDKEPDAEPFKAEVPENKEELAKYQRDYDRLKVVRLIYNDIYSYYSRTKGYPVSLYAVSGLSDLNLSEYKYDLDSDGAGYSLTVHFETNAAVDEIKKTQIKNVKISSDKAVSFNEISAGGYYSFSGTPREPALVQLFSSSSEGLAFIPKEFSAVLTVGGIADRNKKATDAMTKLVFDGNFGDLQVSADVEFRKIDQKYFFIINKMPTLFFDISSIKKKWVKLTTKDLSDSGYGDFLGYTAFSDGNDESKKKQESVRDQVIKIIQVANDTQVFDVVGKPDAEKVDGATAYRYDLKLNYSHIVDFYKNVTSELESYKDDQIIKFDQSTLDSLESPISKQAFEYMNKNSTISIWANAKGVPVRYLYKLRFVPETAPNTTGKEIIITFDTTLSRINKAPKVEEPKDSILFEDAMVMMRGITKEQYHFEQKSNAISNLQSAIKRYHSVALKYPDNLNQLLLKAEDVKASTTNNKLESTMYYINDTAPFLKSLPQDVTYKNLGNDFEITYSVAIPKYDQTTRLSYLYYQEKYPKRDPTKPYSYDEYTYNLKFVDGINTATKDSYSREAAKGDFVDYDHDKLSDMLENYIGTNPQKSDTDSDGRKDGDEFSSGSNPLGPGALKGGSLYY